MEANAACLHLLRWKQEAPLSISFTYQIKRDVCFRDHVQLLQLARSKDVIIGLRSNHECGVPDSPESLVDMKQLEAHATCLPLFR